MDTLNVQSVEVKKVEKEIRQSITDYKMPRYICEILCSHYAKSFLEMTIICENDTYIFSYDKKNKRRLLYRDLTEVDKLQLILTLIMINEVNRQMLIGAERYLIEPELIYAAENRTDYKSISLLFYPDTTMTPFNIKLIRIIDKIVTKNKKKALNCFELIKEELAKNELYRARSIAEKHLNRAINERAV